MRMKLSKFLDMVQRAREYDHAYGEPDVEFVGIKWQEEHHPSAELFPIEFVNATPNKTKVTLKFITTKHNQ